MNFIYETVVYCGARKVFRILNLMSGTIYSMDFETQEEAFAAALKEDGKERAGKIVKVVRLPQIVEALLNEGR